MDLPNQSTHSHCNAVKKPKSHRWRLRWSMRTFFIVLTLLCVVCGLVGRRLYVGLVHADVGEQLTLRAQRTPIRYGFPSPDKVVIIGWTIPNQPVGRIDFANDNKLPTWMKWTGSDILFRRLDRVLVIHDIPDDDLEFTFEQLHRLGELRELLIRRKLSGDELDRFLSPLQIRKLAIYPQVDQDKPYAFLQRIGVTDLEMHSAPVAATEDLPASLERLDVKGSDIDDDSLARFARLKYLKQLDLSGTLATESGVKALRRQMPWCEITWKPRPGQNRQPQQDNPSP